MPVDGWCILKEWAEDVICDRAGEVVTIFCHRTKPSPNAPLDCPEDDPAWLTQCEGRTQDDPEEEPPSKYDTLCAACGLVISYDMPAQASPFFKRN